MKTMVDSQVLLDEPAWPTLKRVFLGPETRTPVWRKDYFPFEAHFYDLAQTNINTEQNV